MPPFNPVEDDESFRKSAFKGIVVEAAAMRLVRCVLCPYRTEMLCRADFLATIPLSPCLKFST